MRHAVIDGDGDPQFVERRGAAAETSGARQRPAFQPPQQLFDVEAGERAVAARQDSIAVERLRQREGARSLSFQRQIQIAPAAQRADVEQLGSATELPTTLARAFSENGPKPLAPGSSCPAQRVRPRNEAVSALSVPSSSRLERVVMVPSKDSFSGVPESFTFQPDISPPTAAMKSAMVKLPSSCALCQVDWPRTEKAREPAGSETASSIPPTVSLAWFLALR